MDLSNYSSQTAPSHRFLFILSIVPNDNFLASLVLQFVVPETQITVVFAAVAQGS